MNTQANDRGLVVFFTAAETPDYFRDLVRDECRGLALGVVDIEIDSSSVYSYDLIRAADSASIVVLDITKISHSLHYFMGVVIGLDKPVLLVEDLDDQRPVPFDVARITTLGYTSRPRAWSGLQWKLRNELTRAVESPANYQLLRNVRRQTKVFVSYARSDASALDAYRHAMRVLEDHFALQFFVDESIDAGEQWRARIERELGTADVALTMLSPAFHSSTFIGDVEMPRIREAYQSKHLLVVPIILTASDHESWLLGSDFS
jgi:hypothetical protein